MSWGHFWDYLGNPAPQMVLWLALAAALCVMAGYVVGKLRRGFRESGLDASNMMSNFRDLHSRGELSDEEYRTIKARLAERLQRQLEVPERKPDAPGQLEVSEQERNAPQPQLEVSEQELEGFGQDTEQDG